MHSDRNSSITATGGKMQRIAALDFTKGALVLFMVLYHWLNYFISTQGDFLRYLRFVTPSFIFITGFLISNVYLSKYEVSDMWLPTRLIQRGLKILAVFLFLNVIISLLFHKSYSGKITFGELSLRNITAIFITGNIGFEGIGKAAAFHILVPISYLLLMSAGLLIVYRFYKNIFHVVCVFFFLCIFILDLNGLQSANVELLTIGLLGVIFGTISITKINDFVRRPYTLFAAYLCYTLAITVWNVVYPLQVVGVCLSLMLIYMFGAKTGEPGRTRRHIILLGKYSLFGYIVQIAVLQLLYRSLWHIDFGVLSLVTTLFVAVAFTMLSVELVDFARVKSTTMDTLYKTVFS
jgi:peptidoglycan/LPS O-acetylase OafA/YrhL